MNVMKIVVSYISSLYDREETIKRICETSADGIHADFMDGKYVPNLNFNATDPIVYLKNATKPVDIHLMVESPSSYLNSLYEINPVCIYIHPETEESPAGVLGTIASHRIMAGIAINPDEDISKYEHLYPLVKRVLLMSVKPGYGGQTFMEETIDRLKELKKYQERYNFEIIIDGGINDETIKTVLDADLVVCGSFICNHENYEEQIQKLK